MLDVGGGDSRLVDHLLDRGLSCISILDVSPAALDRAKARLGPRSAGVRWIEADVTADWNVPAVDIWHDRAVFHFLTAADDRQRYVAHVQHGLRPGGSLIVATFGPGGPTMCSGLPTVGYSPASLHAELGLRFALHETVRELHRTPGGAQQEFWYCRFTLR